MPKFFAVSLTTTLLCPLLLTGCLFPSPVEKDIELEESAIAPEFAPVAESDYLYPVPNRPGFYTEPQNFEGLIYSDLPPGSAVQSPYTGEVYLLPAPRGPRPQL